MQRNNGYEYRYRFELDDAIIPRCIFRPSEGAKTLLFEVRTNFILRTTQGEEEILGSERLYGVGKGIDFASRLTLRLNDYWFTGAAYHMFIREGLSFARLHAAELDCPRYVIPVAVEFDVCTVQQSGEALSGVVDRAIRPEHLMPLFVSSPDAFLLDKEASGGKLPVDSFFLASLTSLPRMRVADVDEGLKMMSECGICERRPTLGAQVTRLRRCGHAFHSHCIVNWLLEKKFCPLCRKGKEKMREKEKRMSLISCV